MEKTTVKDRCAGVLMPIFSLKGSGGIGTLGKEAYSFIDFMVKSKLKIWQVLPVTPTGYGDSPYQSCTANAFNYYLIDLDSLVSEGLLSSEDVAKADLSDSPAKVNYGKMFNIKIPLLRKAYKNFDVNTPGFVKFVQEGKYTDFCVFMALKVKFAHKSWADWEEPYRIYDRGVLERFALRSKEEVNFWQFTQYIFLKQWQKVRQYAATNGIVIMGDLPLYLSYDSVEMWKYGDSLFKVDKNRVPAVISGAPPDFFSEDGQLWGNPVYDWQKMKADGYSWWNKRLADAFALYDIVRLDHFRGFDRYYAVPFGDKTARNGHWEDGPSFDFFKDKLDYNFVVEDLGVLDEGVYTLMRKTGYAGMRELEYAFDGRQENEHRPSNYTKNLVCYTGTHDNMPLKGYLDEEFESKERKAVFIKILKEECLPYKIDADISSNERICATVCELAYASMANITIIPLWDMLALGKEARVNLPGVQTTDNWSWRVNCDISGLSDNLSRLANKYNR